MTEIEQNSAVRDIGQAPLPAVRQPDAVPEHPLAPPPSLRTYAILLGIATIFVVVAFREKADWPGLLINLAAGIFGAVIVLVVVERRLRESEMQSVRRLPRRIGFMLRLCLSASERQRYRYARVFHAELREALHRKLRPKIIDTLLPRMSDGFLLVAPFGTGKTTCLQFVSLTLAEDYLDAPRSNPLPILFPIRRWISSDLEKGLFDHLNSYVRISKSTFSLLMCSGKALLIFDGVDELIPSYEQLFSDQFPKLLEDYPLLCYSASARSKESAAGIDLPVVTLPEITREEYAEHFDRLFAQLRANFFKDK